MSFSGIRLYGKYVSLSLQSQMQYRVSFALFTVANGLTSLLEFFGTAALFARFGSLRGWVLPEVAIFYGMVHTAFALAEAAGRGFDVFHLHVRNGTFDRMMVRPRSTVLQVLGQDFQLLRVGRFAQGLFVLLWGAASLAKRWTAGEVLLVVLSILGGALVFVGLFVLQATLSFWTVEGLEIANTLTYGGVEAAQFPLSIYRRWLRDLFVFVVPLGCINYFPLVRILGRGDQLGYPAWAAWASPAVGLAFFLVSLRVWEVGVRHYRSTGS